MQKTAVEVRSDLTETITRAETLLATAEAEGRDLTPAEQTEYDAATTRATELGEDLQRAEKFDHLRSVAADPRNLEGGSVGMPIRGENPYNAVTRTHTDPWTDGGNPLAVNRSSVQTRALDAIEKVRGDLITDDDREAITRTTENDPTGRTAEYVVAASDPHYERAFNALARDPLNGHRTWNDRELAAFQRVEAMRTAMGLTAGNGGYLVPFTVDPAILLSNTGAINPLRSVCRVEQIVTTKWNGVSSAGVTAEWLAEAAEAADASPTTAQPLITAHKGAAYVQASMELAGDSTIGAQIGTLFADARARQEATAFILGTGSGQPHGVVDALIDASKIVTSTGADTFASGDVYRLLQGVPARWRPNMVVIAGLPVIHTITQFETTNGARLFPEVSDGRLTTKRLFEVTGMDEVVNAAAENYIAAAFDPAQYVIVDRLGSEVVFDPQVRGATNNRPTGEVSWTLFYRAGADLVVTDAGRVLNVT